MFADWPATLAEVAQIFGLPGLVPDEHNQVAFQLEDGLTITLAKPQLTAVIATGKLDHVPHEGDASLVPTLLGLLDSVDHQFPIVTP